MQHMHASACDITGQSHCCCMRTYCMGSKVSSLSRIYLYSNYSGFVAGTKYSSHAQNKVRKARLPGQPASLVSLVSLVSLSALSALSACLPCQPICLDCMLALFCARYKHLLFKVMSLWQSLT
jgi:hypothetical protein